MTMFNPEMFSKTSNKPRHLEAMFEGPVDGGKKLPSVKKHSLLAGNVRLVGYANKEGCFSVRENQDGSAEIGMMYCNPRTLTQGDIDHAVFKSFDVYPGWGFAAMAALKDFLK